MKNKKDLLAIVGLLILATIFSFSYLNFKPKTALSQTTNKYTIFNTQNQGFKFMKNTITGAYYEGENSGTNYGSADPSLIGKRFYLYESTGTIVSDTPYPRLSCDTGIFVDCSDKVFESQYLGTYAGDKYLGGFIFSLEYRERVYEFKESVIVKATYGDVYAPLFAATPDENSPGNQVVTKEYIEKYINPASGFSFGYALTKYSQKDANLVCNPKDTQTFWVDNNQCYTKTSYVASGTVINAVVDPKTKGMNCWDRYWGMERSENKEETFTYFNNDLIKYEVTILQGALWESYPGEIVWWRDYTDWCGVVDVTEPINKLCQNGCVISFTRQGGVQETQGYYSSVNDLKRGNCQDSICAYKDVAGWPQTPCVLKWKVNTNEFYIQDYSGRYQNTGFCGMIIRKL
jgi:hypothetical protein